MKGKNKFTEEEIDQLKNLVRKFSRANDVSTRKTIRSQFRKIGFHVSDFGIQNIDSGKFESLIRSGRIQGSSKIITQKQRIKESSALKKPIEEQLAINLLDEKLINGNFTSAGDLDSKDSLDSKGFYCIKTKEKAALPPRYQRHLKKNNQRIIYIGKAENATLRKRFLGQELRAQGHGTFFRSLGAVLEYTPEPGSLLNYRNKNNYKFSPKNENEIINWINCNLEVNWVSYNGDFAIEADLIKKYKPLLNDTHNPSRLPELMSTDQIAQKLWNLCNVLRDDGVTYHQYLNELTYILFLKLSEVKGFEEHIPKEYRWRSFVEEDDNNEAFVRYRKFLAEISNTSTSGSIKEIYTNASTSLRKPVNFDTLVQAIDKIDWYEEDDRDTMGDIYESLLEKNAGEKKSGAGQYFTPRPLINVMVDLMVPKLGERWNDPAAGTFGFMISANQYLRDKNDDYYKLSDKERKFQEEEAFSGVELVGDAHRLALMNARLHGLESKISYADTLTEFGKNLKNYDGVLANPPFGTKKGGERPSRDDFTFPTSNKQLNFLQHIYRSLKRDGEARAAVVLPDNVLFEDGDGQRIRRDLMDKCDLHTILRLPTGIFYAAGVKTNVLFFTRATTETKNTPGVWFYDMRTNVPSYGKRTPFTEKAFESFIKAYTGGITFDKVEADYDGNVSGEKRNEIKDKRWNYISREEIAKKNDSLDLGLIADESISNGKYLGEPIEIAEEALAELKSITAELNAMIKELK